MLLEISLSTFENSQNEDLKNELQRLYKKHYEVSKMKQRFILEKASIDVANCSLKLVQISAKIEKLESEQNPD